jgi:BirA family biotin operon repressor/biotin-[acetyl-CoA-carboxylase] ligase
LQLKNTIFIGKVLLHFNDLTSTNTYAQELLSKTKPIDGTVIIADYQTAGRGQIGSVWQSTAGLNITLSIILYPKFVSANEQFVLSQAVALGVRSFIGQYCAKPVYVKWPNDIYVENRKIAGILIQNTLSGKNIQSTIVGLGININQTVFNNSIANVTSLKKEIQKDILIQEAIPLLLQAIEQCYMKLKNGQVHLVQQAYLEHLYQYQQWANYQKKDGTVIKARLIGISPQGQLCLQHQKVEYFDLKEIRFL